MINERSLSAVLQASQSALSVIKVQGFSILTHNFNMLYCAALNARAQGITHFCLMHADVIPTEPLWLDKLMNEMETHQADIISAVIPIKDSRGLTSTAIESNNPWKPKRLTMHEIFKLGPTFTHPDLLVNTGLILINITKPFADKLWFRFEDTIINDGKEFKSYVMSEDWLLSRDARKLGASIYATRTVACEHIGSNRFSNTFEWGSWQSDISSP